MAGLHWPGASGTSLRNSSAILGGDPSEAQSIIARRATTLAVWCEQAEAKATAGETLNIGGYATATNTLRRLLLDLGLERRMRDITPSIDAYLSKGPRIKRKPGRREAGRAYTVTRVNMAQPRAALGGVERCRGV